MKQSTLSQLADFLDRGESPPFEWVVAHVRTGSLQKAWDASRDPAAMVRLYARTRYRGRVVVALCACARRAANATTTDPALATAVATAEAWARGSGNRADVQRAFLGLGGRVYNISDPGVKSAYLATLSALEGVDASPSQLAGVARQAVDRAVRAVALARKVTPSLASAQLAKVVRAELPTAPTLAELGV